MKTCISIITLAIICLNVLPASANKTGESAKAQQELKQLKNQINKIKLSVNQSKSKHHAEQKKLFAIEKNLAHIQQQIKSTNSDIKELQKELDGLKTTQKKLEKEQLKQQAILSHQLRSQYQQGQQPMVKFMLNLDNPNDFSRLVHYYQYLNQQQIKLLEKIMQHVAAIKVTEEKIDQNLLELKNKQQQLETDKSQLQVQQKERMALINKINKKIQSKQQQLAQLQQKEKDITSLIQQIKKTRTAKLVKKTRFNKRRGKMRWPAAGKLTQSFGKASSNSALHAKGVMIRTKTNSRVKAIHSGRVVFADWLRGFGLLTIIDHGDNYMSLYAHNNKLERELGEWVQTGDIIARSGTSGGLLKSALYFEIRHKGKALNPAKWCR